MTTVVGLRAKFPLTPHLTEFTDCVAGQRTQDAVLDALNVLAKKCLPAAVGPGRCKISDQGV